MWFGGGLVWWGVVWCGSGHVASALITFPPQIEVKTKKLFTLLDLCVSSLRRGHANRLCIVPILTGDPRTESRALLIS